MLWGYDSDTLEVSVKESKLDVKTQIWNYKRKAVKHVADKSGQINNPVQGDALKVEEI